MVLPYADSEDSISESKETKQQETCGTANLQIIIQTKSLKAVHYVGFISCACGERRTISLSVFCHVKYSRPMI